MNNAMKIEFLIIFMTILFVSILSPNVSKINYLIGRKTFYTQRFPFVFYYGHKTILRKFELNKISLYQSDSHINTDRLFAKTTPAIH